MKKFLTSLLVITVLLIGFMAISASAERMYNTPLTMTQSNYGSTTLFTLTDIYVYRPEASTEHLYQKCVDFNLYGYFGNNINANGEIKLLLYCYDTYGNHIDTQKFTVSGNDLYENGAYFCFDVPDTTAAFEIASEKPAGWSNSLFKMDYINVWSADGRVMAIPQLMEPVYETVGWYGSVTLYSMDGRTIDVPYPNVDAYKKVGWYDYETYSIICFRSEFETNMLYSHYENAFNNTFAYESDFVGTQYENELYAARTKAMDAWRKQVNAPIACGSSPYIYEDDGDTVIEIEINNVSYKTVKAFKLEFTCYDVFGNIEEYNSIYYCDDIHLAPADWSNVEWTIYYNDNIEYISKPIVTQVVYSDNSSWYR